MKLQGVVGCYSVFRVWHASVYDRERVADINNLFISGYSAESVPFSLAVNEQLLTCSP